MKRFLTGVAACALALGANVAAQDEENGMTDDPFLWLEEVEGERALDWVRSQNDRSLKVLQNHPAYQALVDEALAILTSEERVPSVALRGGYAYNFWQDKEHVRGIWRRMPEDAYVKGEGIWETLLDVDRLAQDEGENWVYSGASCRAPDYSRCLVELSRGGSDAAVFREFDLATKSFVEDGFFLPEAKSSVAWLGEDRVLVGTDFGEGSLTDSGYPRQTRVWQRGQDLSEAKMVYEIDKDDIWAYPVSFHDGESYRGGVFHGETFYDFNWLVLGEDMTPRRLPLPKKADFQGYASGDYIIELKEGWEYRGESFEAGSVVALSEDLEETELLFAPTGKQAVQGVSTSDTDVVVSLLDDIESRIVRFEKNRRGWRGRDIRLPEGGVASVRTVEPKTGALIATYEDPLTPSTFYYAEELRPREIRKAPSFFDAEGAIFNRYEATSSDGTKIPYTVIAREDVLKNGPAPTIQYGYGGFEIPILPDYDAVAGKLWVEKGGVFVLTNIRGGGEYGPKWHQAGLKQNRQLIYDDFQAISEDLIERGITTKEQLGIQGRSNGGLLMGVSITQRPDLYEAVSIGVPLLDMLRYDKLLAGASWVGEYGDPDVPEERAFLETISPYQNFDPKADYSRPFFYTSTKDDRVHPGHARKFAKLFEEADKPFLYYENIEGGHAGSSNNRQLAKRVALEFAYFAGELGLVPYEDNAE